ncbi:solute carrier family 23 member 2-like [Actinia tenebrosa]|uniref:Solute carrier family 23 member 2-like n=1 Tax=Actinia tenebrosa TaxID=6105 RepID=A0A6P8I3D5_ACTTE|nr:solute carrier family 23 member 2-like [Actinia tenebrosa]
MSTNETFSTSESELRAKQEKPELRQANQAQIKENDLVYTVDQSPPWYLAFLLGFQHYLTMLGGTLSIPVILSGPMCFGDKPLVMAEVLSTVLFCSGVVTVLQTTFGVRLPILQGGTFSFLAPTLAILSLPKFQCPSTSQVKGNSTGNVDDEEIWKIRMREVQGAIAVSSLFQIFIGFSGLIGFLLRFIGPLTVAPTITLIGLSLFHVAGEHAGNHWGISMMTIAFITLFSQFLSNVRMPFPAWKKSKGFYFARYPCFKLFPIIIAISLSWAVCGIITAAGGFPDDPKSAGYKARTDARTQVLQEAKWFRFPYPGQWGLPTVSAAGVFGMVAGVLASIIESVGDYYACARLSGASPPPKHAVNRGIGIEGIGCLLAGLVGSGNGTTSYSENIGAISITRVGSRRVLQYGGIIMVLVGILGKIGALFTTIPDPIVGGVFMVMFGIIAAVGISNLQFVDLNSSRNLFIVGVSLVMGLALPNYMNAHPKAIETGVHEIDQIITVLFKTGMAVGGMTAFLLDNTIPGTPEERGMTVWRKLITGNTDGSADKSTASIHTYDLPFGLNRLSKYKLSKYVPFIPYYPHEQAGRRQGEGETPDTPRDNPVNQWL